MSSESLWRLDQDIIGSSHVFLQCLYKMYFVMYKGETISVNSTLFSKIQEGN